MTCHMSSTGVVRQKWHGWPYRGRLRVGDPATVRSHLTNRSNRVYLVFEVSDLGDQFAQ